MEAGTPAGLHRCNNLCVSEQLPASDSVCLQQVFSLTLQLCNATKTRIECNLANAVGSLSQISHGNLAKIQSKAFSVAWYCETNQLPFSCHEIGK